MVGSEARIGQDHQASPERGSSGAVRPGNIVELFTPDHSLRPRPTADFGISYPLPAEVQAGVDRMKKSYRQSVMAFPLGNDQPVHVIPEGRTFALRPAVEYLRRHGGTFEEINRLLGTAGNWIYKIESSDPSLNLFDLSPEEVRSYLEETFSPVNDLMDRSLDGRNADGFNKHGAKHAGAVTDQGERLLAYVGAGDDTRRNLVIAAQAHDIGNLLGREAHPFLSVRMLGAIIPRIAKDSPRDWHKIRKAIAFHDSDNLQTVMSRWINLSSKDRLRKLAEYLEPEGLALLIADKVEVGRDRLSDGLGTPGLERDVHAYVNLLGRHEEIRPEGNSFVWTVAYNPDFTEEERIPYAHLVEGLQQGVESGRLDVSYRNWDQRFINTYSGRIVTTAEASLAFFPALRSFTLVTRDLDSGSERKRTFSRDTLEVDMQKFRSELKRKKVRV